MLGFKSGQELIDIVGNAKAVVLPSEWYENGPYSAIEALQVGRPIIGAKIGGIPELVNNNLFKMGNIESLVDALESFEYLSRNDYEKLEIKSKEMYLNYYTWAVHKKPLYEVYEKAMMHHE